MRTKLNLRPVYLAGALTIAISGSALALTRAQSLAQTTPSPPSAPQTQAGATTAQTTGGTAATPARVALPRRPLNAVSGQTVVVRGRLEPAVQGRTAQLQAYSGQSWRSLTRGQTDPTGDFVLRFQPSRLGRQQLRVLVAADGSNAATSAPAGRLTVYHQSVASWYDDGGQTACGFHAALGVASPGLPCGTHVAFMFAGHHVTAVVDDRGPFVPGRDWDLNQTTAQALGFGGVGALWSSI